MGIIYEYMRKLEKSDPSINVEEMDKFINFHDFIDLLELHTDDTRQTIVNHLADDSSFSQLDFYYLYLEVLDRNGEEVNRHYLDETSNTDVLEPLSKKVKYTKFSYDAYKDDDPVSYPTEDFLEYILEDDVDDSFDDMYWKVEDILELDCISVLEIDMKTFKECYDALSTDARTTLNLIRSKQDFKDKQVEVNNDQNFCSDANNLKVSKPKPIIDNNVALSTRSANNASKIIAALASELLEMDLTKPFADETNGRIKAAIEMQGNKLSKDTIGLWLKRAHENSI
ncbi:hypothetical protein [Psychrobacter immobilis]|uniref:hypothetical protein n=1 Tax=Psychrobacter immobilis TaxID=498 RepID=UPI00191B489E|nr:hypothetical protein [Psychrobacter immobilis]